MDVTKTHLEHERKHPRKLIGCRFVPGTDAVLYSSEDYSAWLWNWESGAVVELPTQAWGRGLAITRDGGTVITAGYDGQLHWWTITPDTFKKPAKPDEVPKLQPRLSVNAHEGWIRAVALSPDEQVLATVGNDLRCRLWNVADGTPIRDCIGDADEQGDDPKKDTDADENAIVHRTHIYNVAFHPEGNSLVTGDLMGQLIEWDPATGKPRRHFTAESLTGYDKTFRAQIGGFRDLRFDSTGKRLFASGITAVSNAFAGVGHPSIVEFDWEAGKQTIEYLSKPKLQGVAWGGELHPNGTLVGVHGGSNGNLMFWKSGQVESIHQMKLPRNGRDLDVDPETNRVAVACSDGGIRIYHMDA